MSASLRPSASRALVSACSISSFFSPRLGGEDLDLVPGLTKRFGQQRAFLDLVRQQDQSRRRLVVVELRQEGAQHLLRRQRLFRAREIGAVALVLPGAEEKHLDAGIAALLMDGEHVGLFHACAD